METKIHYVTHDEMQKIKVELQRENPAENPALYFAEIEGAKIQTSWDFILEMGKLFKFPRPPVNGNAYRDWMRDLMWLPNASGFVLIINQFSLMMIGDLPGKVTKIDDFETLFFPWWEGDAEKYMVGGKKKPFAVYLVEQPLESVGPLFEGLADAAEAREQK